MNHDKVDGVVGTDTFKIPWCYWNCPCRFRVCDEVPYRNLCVDKGDQFVDCQTVFFGSIRVTWRAISRNEGEDAAGYISKMEMSRLLEI